MLKKKKEILDFFLKSGNIKIFAIGSLMWNPDFSYDSYSVAKALGFRRCWNIASKKYRGTHDYHGLVFALEEISADANQKEDCCQGLIFRINQKEMIKKVYEKLWQREMVYHVYMPKIIDVFSQDLQRHEKCLTFTVNHDNENYCPDLSEDETIERVCRARGEKGSNLEYFTNALAMLNKYNICDQNFSQFVDKLEKYKKTINE